MTQLFTNNAATATVGAITNVATSITVADGSKFPAPVAPDFALLTLVGLDGNGNENAWEVVKLTERAANVLTVVRGQEGTAAAAWADATRIELRLTAAGMSAKLDADLSTLTDAGALDGTETLPVNKTGAKRTTVQKILDWIKTQAITWAAKQTISGDLEFSGNARRITGDFSNATIANRTFFQSSVLNGATGVNIVPNGSSVDAVFNAFRSSGDLANSPIAQLGINAGGAYVAAARTGTGTYTDLTFWTNNTARAKFPVTGGIQINRIDAVNEGGQVDLSRAVDDSVGYSIDCFGGTTSPTLRFIQTGGGVRAQITGTGNWEVPAYTKLGESSPAIKVKKLTGTTGGGINVSTSVAHGLDASKIVSVTGYVTNTSSQRLAMPFMRDSAAQEVDLYFDATTVAVVTGPASVSSVWTRPFTVFIVYEE